MHLLPLCFLPLPFALCFLTYARRILSSPSSAPLIAMAYFSCYHYIVTLNFCLQIFACQSISHSFLFLVTFYYSVYFCFTINDSEYLIVSLTHSSSIVSHLRFLLTLNRKANFPKEWAVKRRISYLRVILQINTGHLYHSFL